MLVGIANTEDPGEIAPSEAVGSGNGVRNFRCSKLSSYFPLLSSNKMLVIWAGIYKMLVRITDRENPDQTVSTEAV